MSKWVKYGLLGLGVFVVVVFVGILAAGYYISSEMIHNPIEDRDEMVETPKNFGMEYEDVTVVNESGIELAGWFVPGTGDAVIMMHHGYKGDRQSLLEEARLLHPLGYNILFTSMCSHDVNEGELIQFGQVEMEDLDAWYEYLLSRDDIDPDRIGFLGNSLGGTMAIQYAAENEGIKAVAAHTPFSSLDDTMITSLIFFQKIPKPLAIILAPFAEFWAERELGFDTAQVDATKWIEDIAPRPVLIMKAGDDQVVSPEGGFQLYKAAREPKNLWPCKECGHTEFEKKMPEEFMKRVGGFFNRNLRKDYLPVS